MDCRASIAAIRPTKLTITNDRGQAIIYFRAYKPNLTPEVQGQLVRMIQSDANMSATYAGKWHNKSLVDDEPYTLLAESVLYQDMGFQGFAIVNVTVQQPTKKTRGEFTSIQKEENCCISSKKM